MTTKRYFYVIALRNNSNAVNDEDSNYRLASGQVRAETMDSAFFEACRKESVQSEVNPLWTLRIVYDYYRKGQMVSVYISPMADDQQNNE
jgi:hypothetical protein